MKKFLFFIIFVLLLVFILGGVLYYKTNNVVKGLKSSKTEYINTVKECKQAYNNKKYNKIVSNLNDLEPQLIKTKKDLGYIRKLLTFVPPISNDIKVVKNLLINSDEILDNGIKILENFKPVLNSINLDNELSYSTLTPEQKGNLIKSVYSSKGELYKLSDSLNALARDLKDINFLLNKYYKIDIQEYEVSFTTLRNKINFYLPYLDLLPSTTGYPEEKNYLLLLQNSNELRPTGGFIGTYGIVKIKTQK